MVGGPSRDLGIVAAKAALMTIVAIGALIQVGLRDAAGFERP